MVDIVTPDTPELSIAVSGTNVIATITGEAGATHYLKYKGSNHTAWQDGGSRSGNGTITIAGLSPDISYTFIAYSKIGSTPYSLPSVAYVITLSTTAVAVVNAFDSQIIDDANIFLDAFAETISYLPFNRGSRTIKAIVDREGARGLDGMQYGNAPLTSITVANNSTTGISSAEIDPGKDKVSLAIRTGETVQQRIITKILSQDPGMMTLEIR
jgi:hypothetical protein